MKTQRIQRFALTLVLVVGLALMTALLLSVRSSNVQAQQSPEALIPLANTEMATGEVLGIQKPHAAKVAARGIFTPTWSTEPPVDSEVWVGSHTSLALDSGDNPHISYHDATNKNLKYAHWTGSEWVSQTVDISGTVGTYTSLALDAGDNPHISYYDDTNKNLKYAHWTGSAWVSQTVDSSADVGKYTSLALDAGGNPHISYHDATNGELKYASWTGSAWVSETVGSGVYQGTHTSLALDADGNPHISYFDNINWNLEYAKWTGSTWWSTAPDWDGLVGLYSSLALDASGNPRISYYHSDDRELKYARWTGIEWRLYTADGSYKVGTYTSLALDADDNPHISYYDDPHTDLKYAYGNWSGSEWIIETVDNSGSVGEYSSLALDGDGHPLISYWDGSQGDLKFAWREREDTISTSGGTFAAYSIAQFTFPSGAVTDTVSITYTVLQPSGSRPHVGVFFDITAVYSSTGQPAQLAPGQTYTVVVHYDEAAIPVGVNESNLMLYYWGGSDWLEEPTSVVDTVANTITATPNHFSVWAALGQTDYSIYLPVVLHNNP